VHRTELLGLHKLSDSRPLFAPLPARRPGTGAGQSLTPSSAPAWAEQTNGPGWSWTALRSPYCWKLNYSLVFTWFACVCLCGGCQWKTMQESAGPRRAHYGVVHFKRRGLLTFHSKYNFVNTATAMFCDPAVHRRSKLVQTSLHNTLRQSHTTQSVARRPAAAVSWQRTQEHITAQALEGEAR